ncbi:YbhB/YbcL family Raf kinase inhibitor-like protein [Legionella sp.]|uniref:YbhB/YbcL family Raf kinase inhibitor-like protein n=1 Tax=Legionella sp. TaxID=459 RepID=UPI003CAC7253
MKKYFLLLFLLIFNYKIFAAGSSFTLESSAFKLNTLIPDKYTCNGEDLSPPLVWYNAPPKTQSFVLIMQDPDASKGVWTHWIVFNIPAQVTQLKANNPIPEGATNGKNSWGTLGYRGPCPPVGAHRYVFKLYALDNVLDVAEVATPDAILQIMTGHVLGSAELVGLYQKITS